MEHRNISAAVIALLSAGLFLAGCSNASSAPPAIGDAASKPMDLAAARPASPQEPATFTQHGTSAPTPVRGYNVSFAFDTSTPSAEGLQTIAKAAKAGGAAGVIRIEFLGKADLAGTDKYNMDLSHRRADAVRDALLDDGVTSDRIDEHWAGEHEPLVPTVQGVREERSHVVEIAVR
jgi:OmpA-OmpF porin, OOP family